MIDPNDLAHPSNVPHGPRYHKAWQERRAAEQEGATGSGLERLRAEELRLRREVNNHAVRHTPDRMRTSSGRNQYVSAVRLMQRRNTWTAAHRAAEINQLEIVAHATSA